MAVAECLCSYYRGFASEISIGDKLFVLDFWLSTPCSVPVMASTVHHLLNSKDGLTD